MHKKVIPAVPRSCHSTPRWHRVPVTIEEHRPAPNAAAFLAGALVVALLWVVCGYVTA